MALRRVTVGLLLVCLLLLGMAMWQVMGIVVVVGAWLVAGAAARLQLLHSLAMKLYALLEPQLLMFVEKVPLLGQLFRVDKYVPHDQRLESVEHLLQLVDSSGHVLTDDQRDMVRRGVNWHTTAVGSIMVSVKDIMSVKYNELLGPLVLDDLHRSGHNRFPVFRGSIDNIIGILDITDLLEVSATKRSETAEQTMSSDVLRIEFDEPLPAAMALLQKSHRHMLIVVDEGGRTAGLVTLADIAGSLLGKNRG